MSNLKPLFPGKEIVLNDQVVAIVFPLGFKHIRKFSRDISGALLTLMNSQIPENIRDDSKAQKRLTDQMFQTLIPYAIDNLLDLISECIKFKPEEVKIDDLPHWDVAKLIEAWIIESFGEEKKYLPWIAAVENIFAQVTGEKKSISEIFSIERCR